MNETYEKVIRVLENERACALSEKCQRPECAQCELVMDTEDVIFALDFALEAVRNLAELEEE